MFWLIGAGALGILGFGIARLVPALVEVVLRFSSLRGMVLDPFAVLIRGEGVVLVVLLLRMPELSNDRDAEVVRLPGGLSGFLFEMGSDL